MVAGRYFNARKCEESTNPRVDINIIRRLNPPPPTPVLIHGCFVVSRLERELKESLMGLRTIFELEQYPVIGNHVTQVGKKGGDTI